MDRRLLVWRDGELPPEEPSEQRPSVKADVKEETVMDAFERRAKTLMTSLGGWWNIGVLSSLCVTQSFWVSFRFYMLSTLKIPVRSWKGSRMEESHRGRIK